MADEFGDDGAFEAEGEIAGIAEKRHFEELEAMNIRDGVDPLCETVPVPKFPEKAADKGSEGEAENAPPIPLFEFGEEGGAMGHPVQGDPQEQGRAPYQGVELIWKNADEEQSGTRSGKQQYTAS